MCKAEVASLEGTIDKPAFLKNRLCEGAITEHTIIELTGEDLLVLQMYFIENLVAVFCV